jgi:hypothetical protein
MELIKIGTADIILQDFGDGKGKIIISDSDWDYNFSYFWGSMGVSLKDFLCRIDSGYFIGKLCPSIKGPISGKRTLANIRRSIRENMSCHLPWYKHMEFQKDMREKLNDFEREFQGEDEFIRGIENLVEWELNFYLIEDRHDRESIKKNLEDVLCSEPWYYIEYDNPHEHKYLEKLHKKLKKIIKKQQQLVPQKQTIQST